MEEINVRFYVFYFRSIIQHMLYTQEEEVPSLRVNISCTLNVMIQKTVMIDLDMTTGTL
jgi:hypothetical protein